MSILGKEGNPLGELLNAFGPSALFASGQGMRYPLPDATSDLTAFLQGKTLVWNPRQDISISVGSHIIFGSYADVFTLTHWLLFYSVGWAWRLFGVSIASLHLLVGLLGGLTALSVYYLFRMALGRVTAIVGAALVLLLPAYTCTIISLRDFAKAPFIVSSIAFMCGLLYFPRTRQSFLRTVLLLAVVMGIGFGFRQDVLICLPPALAVLFIAPLKGGYYFPTRIYTTLLLLFIFSVIAFPVFRGMANDAGSVSTHTLFQGLSRDAEHTMNFGSADYDLLLTPSDPEVHACVNAHVRMRGNTEPMNFYLSAAYARAGRKLFKEWAQTFPADMWARCLASVDALLRISSITVGHTNYTTIEQNVPFKKWHNVYVQFVEPLGLVYVFLLLVFIGVHNPWGAMAVVLLMGYFMAYPSLLFQIRHAFHLSFIVPFALLFCAEKMVHGVPYVIWPHTRKNIVTASSRSSVSQGICHACIFWVLLFLLSFSYIVVLIGLRYIQRDRLKTLVTPYRNASLIPLETNEFEDDQTVLICPVKRPPGLEESWNLPAGDTATSYLALSFERREFGFPVRIQYKPSQGPYLTRDLIIPARTECDNHILLYIPLYELANFAPAEFYVTKHRHGNSPLVNFLVYPLGTNRFEGIRLTKNTKECFKGIYYVSGHHTLPWLMYLRFSEKMENMQWFKRTRLEFLVDVFLIECSRLFRQDTKEALDRYGVLLSKHPENRLFLTRIESLVNHLHDPREKGDVLVALGNYSLDKKGYYAVLLSDLAKKQVESGDYVLAEHLFHQASLLVPTDMWHKVHRADALTAQGRNEEALQLYREVLYSFPESPYSASQVDRLLTNISTPAERKAFWENLCRAHEHSLVPWIRLATVFEEHGEYENAKKIYENLIEQRGLVPEIQIRLVMLEALVNGVRPDIEKIWTIAGRASNVLLEEASICIRHGNRFLEKNEKDRALEFYETAIMLVPDDLGIQAQIADLLSEKGMDTEALQKYRIVLLGAPESPYSANQVDKIYEKMDDLHGLCNFWLEITHAHPNSSIPFQHLGLAYQKLGDKTGARASFKRSLKNNPENKPVKSLLEALEAAE